MSFDGDFIRFNNERFQLPARSTEPERVQTTGRQSFQGELKIRAKKKLFELKNKIQRFREVRDFAVQNEIALIIAGISAGVGIAGGIYIGMKLSGVKTAKQAIQMIKNSYSVLPPFYYWKK